MDMKKILQALDTASTKPVEGSNDMKKFLSVVTEGANPHKVTLPVQMAMQHYAEPAVEKPRAIKEVKKSAMSGLLHQYYTEAQTVVDEEAIAKKELISEQARQIAERILNKDKPVNKVTEAVSNPEYDDEAGMADNNLSTLERAVDGIDDLINAGDNLPEWCQEKIAIAKSMLVTVWDYMKSEETSEQDVSEDAEPIDREFHLVKKLGRLGQRIVENPKLWDKYSEVVESDNPDWIISLIQDGTGATFNEVLKLSDLFGEIGGGLGRIIDFAWAVKEGTWEEDFMGPYRKHRSQDVSEGSRNYDDNRTGFGRGYDHRGLEQELAHETNNYAVSINGKQWKVFGSRQEANRVSNAMERKYPEKKIGVHATGAPVSEGVK